MLDEKYILILLRNFKCYWVIQLAPFLVRRTPEESDLLTKKLWNQKAKYLKNPDQIMKRAQNPPKENDSK